MTRPTLTALGSRKESSVAAGLPPRRQGQLPGATYPANRALIQLIWSATDAPITPLASRFGYFKKRIRLPCLHMRATVLPVISADMAGSASPLITRSGPWAGFWPGVFLLKNSVTNRLLSQPGLSMRSEEHTSE